MLKQLTHPNIVKFHEFFERTKTGQKDKKQLILVTELMTSGTLKT
jgi:serine/threonine protein kinase